MPNVTQLLKNPGCRKWTTIPRTYMSAAGFQSEVHPTNLAKIAVHETKYRKEVNIFRMNMQQNVQNIIRDQTKLKSHMREYRKRRQELLDENRLKKIAEMNDEFLSKKFLGDNFGDQIAHQDNKEREVNTIVIERALHSQSDNDFYRRAETTTLIDGRDSVGSDSLVVLPPEDASTANSRNFQRTGTRRVKISKKVSGNFSPELASSIKKLGSEAATALVSPEIGASVEIESSKTQGVDSSLKPLQKPPLEPTDNHDFAVKAALMNIGTEIVHSGVNDNEESYDEQSPVDPFPTIFASANKLRKTDHDTINFMQLVRARQNKHLTHNMKLIDSLISKSKNRNFSNANRVDSTSVEQPSRKNTTRRVKVDINAETVLPVILEVNDTVQTSLLDELSLTVDSTDTVHSLQLKNHPTTINIDSLSAVDGSHIKQSREQTQMSLPASVASVLVDHETHLRFPNISRNQARSPHSKIAASYRQYESLDRYRKHEKFMHNEKMTSQSWRQDVTWREKLEKLRYVHSIAGDQTLDILD